MLASQRIESVIDFSNDDNKNLNKSEELTKRGAAPTFIEWMILSWVSGLIWSEVKQLWDVGLKEYVHDMWNVIDFITNSLYVATVALRVSHTIKMHQNQLSIFSYCSLYLQVQKELELYPQAEQMPREKWDAIDPLLISEGLFSAGNIFSSLKLVYIFSVNPHLGPLQVSLSRMVTDIIKFFFLYVLVLFAFSSGLNQLLWYYADLEKKRCIDISSPININATNIDTNACIVWRRFANLFETTQTLFWAAFGLIDLDSFELDGIKIFTRFWGMLMFGCYSVINIVVLLNLLIAMMNHSYQLISERADTEWKFARSKLWISYFEEGATCPPPFNIIPTPKSLMYFLQWLRRKFFGQSKAIKKEHMKTIRKVKQASERDFRYQSIMRNLVRRYVTVQQRKAESQGVTEDDVNEIKQDISAFRCELVEILKNSGMNTSTAAGGAGGAGGKKNRQKERRLMKGFNVAPSIGSTSLTPLSEHSGSFPLDHHGSHEFSALSGLFGPGITPRKNPAPNPLAQQQQQNLSTSQSSFGDSMHKLSRFAPKFHSKRNSGSHKRKWGTLIEAAKSGSVSRFIGRSRSEDSVCNSPPPNLNRNESASNSPNSDEAVTESPTDSNPSLDKPDDHHHHHHHHHHHTKHQSSGDQHSNTTTSNNDTNSNVHNSSHSNNNKKDHHHHLHMPHVNLNFSALAALKRKRKKFSNSRNESPVLEPPPEHPSPSSSSLKKSIKKTLQRASSVPTRSNVPDKRDNMPPRHEQTQSQDQTTEGSQEQPEPQPISASTTEESVAPTSTEPLLNLTRGNMTIASNIKFELNGQQALPNLPNIIPLQGHLHQQGWL
ncbi:hypothetical protein PVAND_006034 [Polypedilum vanderplanki]|uniref:Ion transport domain-containing protein n=1 Tax=Polypedilum vanderplanki TaxID=319348 RepID=A0A9J6C1W4_POLVA|nr:hypothetical protein PVAND_006034 [Polypedilum vanderplanki]